MTIRGDMITVIGSAVDAMTTAGGYNWNYGPVNIYDPTAWVLPQVSFEYSPEREAEEQMAGRYNREFDLTLRVMVPGATGTPHIEQVAKVQDDIKKMFYANTDTFQAEGMTLFTFGDIEATPRRSDSVPFDLRIPITIEYRQLRATPGTF